MRAILSRVSATVSPAGYGGCTYIYTILTRLPSFGGKPKIGKLIVLVTGHLCIHPRLDGRLGDVLRPQMPTSHKYVHVMDGLGEYEY